MVSNAWWIGSLVLEKRLWAGHVKLGKKHFYLAQPQTYSRRRVTDYIFTLQKDLTDHGWHLGRSHTTVIFSVSRFLVMRPCCWQSQKQLVWVKDVRVKRDHHAPSLQCRLPSLNKPELRTRGKASGWIGDQGFVYCTVLSWTRIMKQTFNFQKKGQIVYSLSMSRKAVWNFIWGSFSHLMELEEI